MINKFILPNYIKTTLNLLNENFEAYIVGGAVRDFLRNEVPSDYDICTNALPEEIKTIFSNYKIVETGIKHGTVTVIIENSPIEITTFRDEKDYQDHRHPNSVEFTKNLYEDLSRRDFTINAIAYSPQKGLIDPFGGINDIQDKIIRTVGEPYERFNEDCLRMLRAVRFASTLGFEIEEKTQNAINSLSNTINFSSKERQMKEFSKFIVGDNISNILSQNKILLSVIIPEFVSSFNCNQETKYHKFNVFDHTLKALECSEKNFVLRMAVLFHDIGKPFVKTIDENLVAHFHGHAQKGSEITFDILKRLKFSNKQINTITLLVKSHYRKMPKTDIQLKKLLKEFGEVNTVLLLNLMYCDACSKADFYVQQEKPIICRAINNLNIILQSETCYKISHLAIKGSDIENLVKEKKDISLILNKVLDMVIENKLKNDKKTILNFIIGGLL